VQSAECRCMKHQNLQDRTRTFALSVIKFTEQLQRDDTSKTLGRQLLRSGTSVGANYRAACRSKSKADFISKMSTVLEEADESAFWIELLLDAKKAPVEIADPLLKEANELIAIAAASINTAKRNSDSLFTLHSKPCTSLVSVVGLAPTRPGLKGRPLELLCIHGPRGV
jgi:four helix bundle protein